MANRLVNRLVILVVLFLLVGCDHASKGVAKAELESEGARELIRGIVSLRYVENTDIAFNLLRWVPESIRFPALVSVGAVVVAGLGWLLLRAPHRVGLPLFALVLVTAGAVGNYLDRIVRGYVVDFVHLTHWPVFNVADVYITAGYAVFGWALLTQSRRRAPAD